LAEEGRVYRVGETRVSLDSVIYSYRSGSTAEEIVRDFDTLKLADVHMVLAYYLNHRADVDAYLAQREVEAERIRLELVSKGNSPADPAAFCQSLLERRNTRA
jgi:uncharacterized protein (DUF433 family)